VIVVSDARSTVEVEAVGDAGVFVIRMQNPPVNALTPALVEGLGDALDQVVKEAARVIVVASGVAGSFAAGADIKTMVDVDHAGFVAYGRTVRAAVERLAALDRPTIAAIEGNALGGGLEVALACHLRVAGRDARLGLPEAKIGLIPSAGATQRLPRVVGRGRALDLMLTARAVKAEEALDIGLIDRLAEPGEAEADAVSLATQVASLSIPALMSEIRLVDAGFDLDLEAGLAREVAEVEALLEGPDAREGMRAFVEKRRPRFQ